MSGSLRNDAAEAVLGGERRPAPEPGSVIADEVRAVAAGAPRSARTATASRSCRRTCVETRNSVAVGVDRVLDGADRAGVGRVEHVQAQASRRCVPNDRRSTSGASDEPPMPSSTHVGEPVADGLLGERHAGRRALVAHALGDRQPAEAVGDLGLPRARPRACRPCARCAARRRLVAGLLDARARSAGSSSSGSDASIVGGRPRDDRLALGLDAGQQLLHRRHERVDAVAQQLVGDVVMSMPASASALQVRRRGPGRPSRR